MKHLDLFSGIGGFALAARNVGWETVAFCEIEPFCQKILRKHWPDVPIHSDIKELHYDGSVDIITGGFPCQPFSNAAHGRNNAQDLWPEMARVIGETRPRWVVAENVSGKGNVHIDRACNNLESQDYWAQPFDFGVPLRDHIRRRIYIIAHANRYGEPRFTKHAEMAEIQEAAGTGRDKPETMGMDDGVPRRMDRLRALGNAIEVDIAELIFRAIDTS